MIDKLVVLFCVSNVFLICATQDHTLVSIPQGYLRGKILTAKNGRKFSSFLGIPYAKPPVGELRFKNPEPGQPWEDVRNAFEEAKICPQPEEEKIIGNEDCLYLNVHTPYTKFNFSRNISNLLPVMVWFHGGGFFWGNGNPSFLGQNFLLSRDVVLVTLNYRLGILGFLSTGDSVAPGNFGMKDQVLALKWVQRSIRNFGGDPNRVTIFGESSGASSVLFLALSDLTHGLFHRYIVQSGTVLTAETFRSRDTYKPFLNTVGKQVGCSQTNSETFVKCLRNQTVEKLLNSLKVRNEDFPLLHWLPTNEPPSRDAFITDSPENLIRQNKLKDLPAIVGSVADEGLFLTLLFYTNISTAPVKDVVRRSIVTNAEYYFTKDKIPKFVKAVEDYYFSGSIDSLSREQVLDNYTQFLTEGLFLYPQMLLLNKMATYAKCPSYSYLFDYRGNNSYTELIYKVKGNVGVMHSDELLYLFSGVPISWYNKNDKKILDLMLDLWTTFATNGTPKSNQLENPYLWQPYNQCLGYLRIGDINNNTIPSVTMQHDFYPESMRFWKKNLPIIL